MSWERPESWFRFTSQTQYDTGISTVEVEALHCTKSSLKGISAIPLIPSP